MKPEETQLLVKNSELTISILNHLKENPLFDNSGMINSLIEMHEEQILLILNLPIRVC